MKRRSQPRIKGVTRVPTTASVVPALDRAERATARHFGVSRSWVSAFIRCQFYGIPCPSYEDFARSRFAIVRREKERRRA